LAALYLGKPLTVAQAKAKYDEISGHILKDGNSEPTLSAFQNSMLCCVVPTNRQVLAHCQLDGNGLGETDHAQSRARSAA